MKKVLAIILAAVLVLSCNMTAFAMIKVDGENIGNGTHTYERDAGYVSTDTSTDNLTVTGKVDDNSDNSAIDAKGGVNS